MSICLGKGYSYVSFVNVYQCVCTSFPFNFEGGTWDLIVLVSDHCRSIYFEKQGNDTIGIINFERLFSKFYHRRYKLVSKFKVGLKSLLQQGLSEPEFYGDLVYKLRKIVSRADFFISSEKLSCVTNV